MSDAYPDSMSGLYRSFVRDGCATKIHGNERIGTSAYSFHLFTMGGQEPPIQAGGWILLDGRVLPGHGVKDGVNQRELSFIIAVLPERG
jgi:hypothetical protein